MSVNPTRQCWQRMPSSTTPTGIGRVLAVAVNTWDGTGTAEVLAEVLRDQPAVLAGLEGAWDAAWAAVDPVLLELCRLRTAQILGCSAELSVRIPAAEAAGVTESMVSALINWPTAVDFGARERACLAYTEHYLMDVASLDDATVAAVSDHLGPEGLNNFVSALLVVEQRQRLRLAWENLFGGNK